MRRQRRVYPVIAAAMVAGLAGCSGGDASGKPTAHLSGRVTIEGEPVPGDARGTVDFHPATGGMAQPTSAVIEGGKYDCPNVPIGDVLVYFNINRPTGRMISEDGGTLFPEREQLVPEDKQGMQIQVAGDETRDFDL